MKRRIGIGLIVVIILVCSYFLVTLKGLNYSGVYDEHIGNVKPFENLQEQFAVDLEFLYNEVKNNYVNLSYKESKFNFNWDQLYQESIEELKGIKTEAEFFELASKLFANLRDGHSMFTYIQKSPYDFNSTLLSLFRVRYIENKPIIVAAVPSFTSNILGKEIVAIDGTSFNDIVDSVNDQYGMYQDEILGRSNIVATNRFWDYFFKDNNQISEKLVFELRDNNNQHITWDLDTKKVYDRVPLSAIEGVNYGFINNPLPSYRVLDNNIGYIKIPTFNGERRLIKNRFNEIVLRFKELGIKAVAIDIRNNRGGNASYRDILGYLTDKPIDIAHYRMRKSERLNDIYYLRELYEKFRSKSPQADTEDGYSSWFTWAVKPSKEQFLTTVPTAVLVNERIFSSADSFAKACLDYDLAKVVGNIVPLSGHGLPTSIALPSGKYAVTYGFFEIRGTNFEYLENTTVSPDVYSELMVSDILQGIDTQLQDAVQYLRNRLLEEKN